MESQVTKAVFEVVSIPYRYFAFQFKQREIGIIVMVIQVLCYFSLLANTVHLIAHYQGFILTLVSIFLFIYGIIAAAFKNGIALLVFAVLVVIYSFFCFVHAAYVQYFLIWAWVSIPFWTALNCIVYLVMFPLIYIMLVALFVLSLVLVVLQYRHLFLNSGNRSGGRPWSRAVDDDDDMGNAFINQEEYYEEEYEPAFL